uniref:Uncharacterized protein n=1 Tax=Rhizophora mucronata TaxID=61149 RepID=A0A2P2P8N6_RHIMU
MIKVCRVMFRASLYGSSLHRWMISLV